MSSRIHLWWAALLVPSLVSTAVGQTCLYSEPASDYCQSGYARVIPGTPGQHMVMMDVGTATGNEVLCNRSTGRTVWFEVIPTVTGTITISTCHPATTYDTVLQVYEGGDANCEMMSPVACNDDTFEPECENGCSGRDSRVAFWATAGTWYHFAVGAYNDNEAGCPLCLGVIVTIDGVCGMPPTNLACQLAYELPGDPGVHEVEVDATDVPTPPENWPCSTNVGHVVWFKVTPEHTGPITFSTCTPTTTYDTVVWVFDYEETECTGWLFSRGCDDDTDGCTNPCGTNAGTEVTWMGTAGFTHYIRVGAFNDNSAGCVLCLGARLTITEDTTPPIAEITSPNPMACVCGSQDITGSAYDPDGYLDHYTLEYQLASGGSWVNIATAYYPVINGTLATWDTRGLSEGYYILRLTATNAYGLTSNAIRVVWVDQTFGQFAVSYPPDGGLLSGDVCFLGTMSDHCFSKYTVKYRPPTGGDFLPVDPNMLEYEDAVINDQLAHWDTVGLGLANGSYTLEISAWTTCNTEEDPARTEYRYVSLDNSAPEAALTAPTACENVSGVVEVHGIALDDHLAGWALYYAGGYGAGWTTIATGSTPVMGGVLAYWDTTGLPDCGYTLLLVVTDASVRDCNSPFPIQSAYLLSVSIGGGGGESRADINCDGLIDGLDVNPFVECVLQSECPPCP